MDGETGEVLWSQHYSGEPASNESACGITSDRDGNPFVTGRVHTPTRGDDIFVAKLAMDDGRTIWIRFIPGAVDNVSEKCGLVAPMDNGDAAMVNRTWLSGRAYDVVAERYAAADGAAGTSWS